MENKNFDMQELIEKATPKKAITARNQEFMFTQVYICPKCKRKIPGKISKYCYNCGQALKYED